MKKFWRKAKNVSKILTDAPRNLPVETPVYRKSSRPAILKSITGLVGEISKKLPSRTPEKTVQGIFQKAQETARKSAKAAEKLRQKAPPQVQNVLPNGFGMMILLLGGVLMISALVPILAPIIILLAVAGMIFNDD